ncbi:cation:proton antiporter [Marinobacterium jannaschii]|uniref:cation:proton antiporter n=1 Tax=Marinobacterium jannaschii TaxID=64970 RepID=UPI000484A345|nr:monovalent cation/H(+) antiporter subunit G [Marinobacterium jannaschii]
MTDLLGWGLLFGGSGIFIVGSIGLWRLPDLLCRLHALTKADNLGLGLVASGLALLAADAFTAIKLLLIWLLILVTSAAVSQFIARQALTKECRK